MRGTLPIRSRGAREKIQSTGLGIQIWLAGPDNTVSRDDSESSSWHDFVLLDSELPGGL